MRERSVILESPGTYVTAFVSRGNFFLGHVFLLTALPCLMDITWRGVGCNYMMRLG